MLDILFFAGLGLYFAAMLLQFFGQVWQKETISTLSWRLFMAGFAAQTA